MKGVLLKLKSIKPIAHILHHAGMGLVYFGAILLIVSYFLGWTNVNALLIVCLLLIAAGIVIHVLTLKGESLY